MDGGGRILRSLSEAIGLSSTAWDRPLLAGAGFPARAVPAPFFLPAGTRRQAGRTQAARTSPASRESRFVAFAKRRGTPLLIFSLIGTSIAYGAVRGGGYAAFVEQYGRPADIIARNIGFPIAAVAVSGESGLTPSEILDASGISTQNSLAFLDVAGVRDRLRTIPLVKEASVRKLYPDRLAIDITERQPYALWQQDGRLSVIASDGTVIDTMRDGRFVDLPFVVGEGANTHLSDYLALIDKAGDLKSKIRAGVLVSERRWTLTTTNGIEIMLPEHHPERALAALASLDREARILDKDVISLDLRLPDRVVARLSEEAFAQRSDALARKNPKPKAGQT
ncbi:MAG: FtsQ-type POTRA domain-containing protein [Methylobacteriaceae bacterium]|nr:FtsQ-type POTRA domain-containing protein [Methylobacteriaceae bacterium]